MIAAPSFWDLRAGQQFRAGFGVTTVLADLDFETACAAGYHWNEAEQKWGDLPGAAKNKRGLEVVGRRNYVKHPTFRVLSLSYNLKDGLGKRRWRPGQPPPHDLLEHVRLGGIVEAWNSGFEFDVWNECCVPTFGWPPLPLEQTRCAMAKARAHAGPGKLERFGQAFKLVYPKDPAGKRLLDKFSTPRNPTKKNPKLFILPEDDPEDFAKLLDYNDRDILTEAEASLRTPDLPPDELEIWLTDQRINLRGIQVDLVGMENCISIVEQAYTKYNAELRALTNGAAQAASETEKIKDWLASRGVHIPNMQEETIADQLKDMHKSGYSHSAEYRVLEIRALLGSASIKKLFAFRHQNHLGRLYDLYSYFAARTGRWTGNGPQPQNLPSGLFHSLEEVERALAVISHRMLELVEVEYPGHSALEVVSSVLRGLLIAAPGYEFICSDYTAIEGVVAAAVAGEEWRLDVFRTHGMIYEASAAKMAKIPFDDFVKHRTDTGGVATYKDGKLMGVVGGKHHPLRKKLGKFGELGSGFGGWIGAWKGFGADEYLTDEEIKQGLIAWRNDSPAIVYCWGGQKREVGYRQYEPSLFGFEGAAIAAVQWRGKAFGYRGVTYQMSEVDDVLYCRTLSGGFLTYHRPRLAPATREWCKPWELSLSYEGENKNPKMGPIGWVRMSLYGGKQFENVIQKEARYIHATGLVGLDRAGYRPVIHSHDEPCGEVPIGFGSVEEFESIMTQLVRTPGSFCYGWPIKASGGWRGPRYGKFE